MICLTGDLHHASLGTGNQKHCDRTEIAVARLFHELVTSHGVKATYFVSGRSFVEEWDELKPICEHPLVEIGGHNWSCFEPELWHRFWNKATGSYNGPRWYQERDARRTIEIIRFRTGQRIRAWRNHMYMHGPHTEEVLSRCGIRVCSDGVRKNDDGGLWHSTGLLNLPINILPDHEHLYHAERTPEWVASWVKRYGWSDDFGSESYYIHEWTERVLAGLEENERRGALSVLIVHPITMYLCDRFHSFREILRYISERPNLTVSDAWQRAVDRRAHNLRAAS
jgi:hypothetical protein